MKEMKTYDKRICPYEEKDRIESQNNSEYDYASSPFATENV